MSRRPAAAQADPHAGSPPKRTRCTAHTATGSRCTRKALHGSNRCAQHVNPTVARAGGRPSKLTKDVERKIIEILKLGGYAETAAQAAGVSARTYREWMQRGDPDGARKIDAPYRRFRELVEQTVAELLTHNIAFIRNAASTDWKAAAWLAEREHPDKYAGPRGRRLDSSHPDDFAAGEKSAGDNVTDDQLGPDGRPL